MYRCTWYATLYPGKLAEYRAKPAHISPEMLEMFRRAGIRNYSIWNCGDKLFGYYECDDPEYAAKVKRESEVMAKWRKYMEGLMEIQTDENGSSQLNEVFYME
ncbi:MAG: L-rhamnose mutarotase [Eubacteriales bacterium]